MCTGIEVDNQINKIEGSGNRPSHIQTNDFYKAAKDNSVKKGRGFSTNSDGITSHLHATKIKVDLTPYLTPYIKINLKYVIYLSLKPIIL